jgi:gamma-glutamylaminecyclotransferase
MHRLFVFGTLKRGFPLHDRALAGSVCRGSYRTSEPFPMLVAGDWFAPMMMNEPGIGRHVLGELYEIADSRLKSIDEMESVGIPGHFRTLISVAPVCGGVACLANVYMKSRDLAVPAHTRYLSEYQDRRFIPPEHRPKGSREVPDD